MSAKRFGSSVVVSTSGVHKYRVRLPRVPTASDSYLRRRTLHEDVPKACRNRYNEPRRLRRLPRLRLRGRGRYEGLVLDMPPSLSTSRTSLLPGGLQPRLQLSRDSC